MVTRQRTFEFKTWGGSRKGAGRKPAGKRAGAEHVRRESIVRRTPLHITMRVANVPSLRAERCIQVLRRAFKAGKDRFGFRLVQYAVQPDHLHLVVEAGTKRSLASGLRGLAIRIARTLNAMLGRRGRVFPERYHARQLHSPREVRRVLAYVLLQARRHAAKRGVGSSTVLDACSSAPLFDGWTRGTPRDGPWRDTVVGAATWLLAVGWRRAGRIDPAEVPGSPT